MAHRPLRLAHGSFDKLSGEVEVDETFIGGKARNMHVAQRGAASLARVARTRLPSSAFWNAAARSERPS